MRLIFALVLGVFALGGTPVAAQSYSEPARGTATRAALMDAIRPHVEWDLGQPIEFVVEELRVAVHHSMGATDVWFAAPDYCIEYVAVIPEWCK